MAVLYRTGDVSRVYFGTETRIGAIALGAVLATVLRRWGGPRTSGGRAVLQGAGVVALGGLAVAWLLVAGTSPWLYRGGFVLLGLAVVVVIGAVVQPESRLARAVSWAPLRGLGLISYGLYLWHWVVIATLTRPRTGLSGLTLDAVQLGVSLAAALVSYWCLEQPIRRRRWVPASQAAVPVAVGAYTAVLGLVVASTLVPPPALGGLAAALQGRAAAVAAPAARPGAGEAAGQCGRPLCRPGGGPDGGRRSRGGHTDDRGASDRASDDARAPAAPEAGRVRRFDGPHDGDGARRLRQAHRRVPGGRERRAGRVRHRPGR